MTTITLPQGDYDRIRAGLQTYFTTTDKDLFDNFVYGQSILLSGDGEIDDPLSRPFLVSVTSAETIDSKYVLSIHVDADPTSEED